MCNAIPILSPFFLYHLYISHSLIRRIFYFLVIRVSVDTLYRDGANDVSRERIQTAPLAHPGRAS